MRIKYYGNTRYYYVVLNGVEVLSLTKEGLKETIKVFKRTNWYIDKSAYHFNLKSRFG